MARIFFKDKRGYTFQLIVINAPWGDGDYNTIQTAEVVQETFAQSNRCLNLIDIGTVTLDFSVNGRTGSCIQCGQCCVNCSHLVVLGPGIGKKNGTRCNIYDRLLYEGLKGCVSYPAEPYEIANCPACGFKFA